MYLLFQGLSVFGAVNLRVFLISFEKVFSSFIFLLALIPLYGTRRGDIINKLVFIIVATSFINILVQLFFIAAPGSSLKILSLFAHPGVVDIMRNNLERGRIYFEFYDEIAIPFLFYLYFAKKRSRGLHRFSLIFLLALVFVSFFSNVRTRFLVTIIALSGSFFVFRKFFSKDLFKIIGVGFSVLFIVFAGYKIATSSIGFSVIDRFLLQDKAEDIETISFRFNMLSYSVEMGNANPLSGVGLGNFYEHIPTRIKNQSFSEPYSSSALLYPHNIFAQTYAETGLFGLLSLVLLIGYCIIKDVSIFKSNSLLKKSVSVSFWSLFIFSLLNPITPLTFLANFFVLRTILEL